jgi:hypothetical protein
VVEESRECKNGFEYEVEGDNVVEADALPEVVPGIIDPFAVLLLLLLMLLLLVYRGSIVAEFGSSSMIALINWSLRRVDLGLPTGVSFALPAAPISPPLNEAVGLNRSSFNETSGSKGMRGQNMCLVRVASWTDMIAAA